MQKQAWNKYKELSNKKKDVKRKYRRNQWRNMSEKDKQKLKEDQKNYQEAKKKLFLLYRIKAN